MAFHRERFRKAGAAEPVPARCHLSVSFLLDIIQYFHYEFTLPFLAKIRLKPTR
jgi:hypothetical protein